MSLEQKFVDGVGKERSIIQEGYPIAHATEPSTLNNHPIIPSDLISVVKIFHPYLETFLKFSWVHNPFSILVTFSTTYEMHPHILPPSFFTQVDPLMC
jgi:hypothetical protein